MIHGKWAKTCTRKENSLLLIVHVFLALAPDRAVYLRQIEMISEPVLSSPIG